WFFFGFQPIDESTVVALILLLIGSVIISAEKNLDITLDYLKITLAASLMFSLDYIFSKLVYERQTFLQGFIWMRIASCAFVLPLLLSSSFRKEIFKKQAVHNKKTGTIFLLTQSSGGIANLLQSFSIYLAPVVFLPIVNALR